MDFAVLTLQGLFAITCFTAPGLLLLAAAERRWPVRLPAVLYVALAFVGSTLCLAMVQAAALQLCPGQPARGIAWAIGGGCVLGLATSARGSPRRRP